MESIKRMRAERAALVEEMRGIVATVESRDTADITAEDRQSLDRIQARASELDADIDRLERSSGLVTNPAVAAEGTRRVTDAGDAGDRDSDEYREAFVAELRGNATPEQRAALNVTTSGQGGVLVPTTLHAGILNTEREFSPIRQLCQVISTSTGEPIKFAKGTGNVTADWVAEATAPTESEPTFGSLTIGAHKLGVFSKVSHELLRDGGFIDIMAYLSEQYGQARADLTSAAYMAGDGTGKPKGILDATNGLSSGRYVTAADDVTIAYPDIVALVHKIKAAYRSNASFLVNDTSVMALRLLVDANERPLWQESLIVGQPSSLLGRPVYVDNANVASIGAGNKVALFGDFRRGYLIRDTENVRMRRLEELYALTDQVGLVMFFETDGALIDENAIAGLKNAAS